MKIKVFLTFDHELPLGGLNTTYRKALFDPTQRVMKLADDFGVKVTLFSDILCGYRFKAWDPAGFYAPYASQLQTALTDGHDVQLHIHPHWLTTTFDGSIFHPSSDFALSDFKDADSWNGIEGIIQLSINHLNEICLAAKKEYTCVAFRAGGYNIFPDTNLIMKSLYGSGIRYDSSMARGYYFRSGISEIDFRKLPDQPNWVIDPTDYRKALTNQSGIMEIPIATIPKSLFELPTAFKIKKYAHRAAENRGPMIHQKHQTDLASKVKMLFSARMLSFDNHTYSSDYLLRIFDHQINRYQKHADEIMFSAIAHPKSMSNYSFKLMADFISGVQQNYPEVRFMTFSELYREQFLNN